MTSTLNPRAWPYSTVVEQKCARETWPFGDLSEQTLDILAGSMIGAIFLFLLCYWVLAPKSFKVVASKLTPFRFAMMSICVLLAGAAMMVYWLVIWALRCYVERMSNWAAYGWVLALWACLLLWVFTAICCLIYGTEGLKAYKQRRRHARNDIELQTRPQTNQGDQANGLLAKPPTLHIPLMKRPEDVPPTYTESGSEGQFHTVPL